MKLPDQTKYRQVSRGIVRQCFNDDWCPKCGKVVKMKKIRTYLPGIQCKQCTECELCTQVNFLEDNGQEMMAVPVEFKFPEVKPVSSEEI